jgi:hypothetical protein
VSAPGNDQTIYYHTHPPPSKANRFGDRLCDPRHTGPIWGDAVGSFRIPVPSPPEDSAPARTLAAGDADGATVGSGSGWGSGLGGGGGGGGGSDGGGAGRAGSFVGSGSFHGGGDGFPGLTGTPFDGAGEATREELGLGEASLALPSRPA